MFLMYGAALEVDKVSAELSLVRSTVLQKCKEAQEARKKCHELEDELIVVRAHLSRCQEGKQDAKNRVRLDNSQFTNIIALMVTTVYALE